MIVLNILGYLCRNKQNSYAALSSKQDNSSEGVQKKNR